MLKNLGLIAAIVAALALPGVAMAGKGHGGHRGHGGHHGHWKGGHGHWHNKNWKGHWGHGQGRWWRGRWYAYGVGSCWRWTPAGWVWICY
jgi:hypothetical protein